MQISKRALDEAARQGLLRQEQVQPLWAFLAGRSRFDLLHLGYYLGALLVIGAFSVFMVDVAQLGKGPLLAVAAFYLAALAWAGLYLWHRTAWRTPGGLLVTASVTIVPLAVYALLTLLGVWSGDAPGEYRDFYRWIRGDWIWLELTTLLAGAVALWRVRFPFLMAPVAFVLWYVSMDLTPILFGSGFVWRRELVSVLVGLAMVVLAFAVDRRTRQDFAFWLYLFGLLAFWGGLSLMDSDSELGKLAYFGINVLLLLVGVLLQRRVFLVFGTAGMYFYLGHLAWSVFKASLLFPLALSLLGLVILGLAMLGHRHRAALARWRDRLVPSAIQGWLPPAR